MATLGGIFISYRLSDALDQASRLHYDLSRRYGEGDAFLDVADVVPGGDWTIQLEEAIERSDTTLVVIGHHWASATVSDGFRRIDQPDDPVRREVAAALRLDKFVIPITVGGASVPLWSDLPEDLHRITELHSIRLGGETWEQDLSALFYALDERMGFSAPARPVIDSLSKPGLPTRLALAFRVLRGQQPLVSPDRSSSSPVPSGLTAPQPHPVESQRTSTELPRAAHGAHEVFISYATEDQGFADDVVRALERSDHACWIAHRDIPAGVAVWAEPVVTAIVNSRLVVVLLSARSNPSRDVQREVAVADKEGIPLLAISLDDDPLAPAMSYYFTAGQRLDLARSSPADQLLRIPPAVQRHLTR